MGEKVVLVCGMPSSGNRLMNAHMKRCGVTSYICHGHNQHPKSDEYIIQDIEAKHAGAEFFALFPSRDNAIRRESSAYLQKIGYLDHGWRRYEAICLATFGWIRRRFGKEQCFNYTYEDLVADPDEMSRRICKFIGVPFQEFPKVHRDDRENIHNPVYDGNAKYKEI